MEPLQQAARMCEQLASGIEARNSQIEDMQTLLRNIRDTLNSCDLNCLGTGSNGTIEWPIRDEVIDAITKTLGV